MPANYQVMYIDMLNYFVYFEQERTARMVSAFLFFEVLTKRREQAPALPEFCQTRDKTANFRPCQQL